MPILENIDDLIKNIVRSKLMTEQNLKARLDQFDSLGIELEHPKELAERLLKSGDLTLWQAENLLRGRHHGFFITKYRLLGIIGRGGMSSVYLAEDSLMKRKCAIKVLPANRVENTSYLERFYKEAHSVSSLNHPNIIRAYDVDKITDKNGDIHYLVMEYIKGHNLHQLVTEKITLSPIQIADYIRQAALGLAHAHEKGLVHRDVKPGNFLLDQQGVVKMLDLGLARDFSDHEESSLTMQYDEKILGTADFLAPEQAVDSHNVDGRADIYSLGCVMYFLLTGHAPFPEGNITQKLLAHQTQSPAPVVVSRPDTPSELRTILEKMMNRDVNERYQSAQEVAEILAAWISANKL